MNKIIINKKKILSEWAYRTKNGKPDPKLMSHQIILEEVLKDFGWELEERNELMNNLTEQSPEREALLKKIIKYKNKEGEDKEITVGGALKQGEEHPAYEKAKQITDTGDDKKQSKGMEPDDFDRFSDKNKPKEKPKGETPKVVKKIFDGSQNSVRDGLLYMSDEDKELFDDFKSDFQELVENPSKELAQKMVDKYGLEVSSGDKPKVYIRNINFEARKILGQNKATLFIKDTVEGALGEPLKGAVKGVDVKQAVTTTSKPDLETKRTAKEDENVSELFKKEPYDRLNPNFHQVFGPVGKDGNLIYPSGGKNAKDYLKQSLSENNSIKRTIERLKELEKSDNVSPKIREALEDHQKNMESILDKYEVPSEEAAQAIGDSYAKMAETINVESPTIAGAMMKNLAEFALYDTEIAKGDECYLPSDGSFPSGDKLKVTRDGGKVERVASVSVKYGRSGKFGSFGFPGETGQYQKYHPNPEYRDRLHSRPGDDGYELGVKDDIVNSDEQMNKIIEESGLGPAIKDNDKLLSVIRENLNEIKKLKEEIGFEQKPKRKSGKPPAWKQLNIHRERIKELEKRLSEELKDAIDEDKLKELVGSDNAKLIMSRPGCMVTALTFASTLRTSNGLDVIEHNHQEIKDGKYESRTDTAEDGTQDLKNWKLTWRAWDSRAGGLIASFNSDRKEYEA
tara:strand:- start:332 stop:2380 length:2049 start_codon:yes stop_codon:yes gene_type:complete